MRNSPVEGVGATRIYSGQSITPHLPWYRGDVLNMEKEALALCRVVDQQLFNSPLSIALDLHSGFGIKDRLWFPYASRKTPFAFIAETLALKERFDRCYQHHIYKIEPMCLEYVISGDLWIICSMILYNDLALIVYFCPWPWKWAHGCGYARIQRIFFRATACFTRFYRIGNNGFFAGIFCFLIFYNASLLYPENWAHLNPQQKPAYTKKAEAFWYE